MPTAPDPVPPKKSRAKPGFVDKVLENDLALAARCQREAAKPDVTPKLLERAWTAADQTALGDSLDRTNRLVVRLKALRTGKITRTFEESTARRELLTALDPILKGARRTYADGSAERAAYGIGEALASRSTYDLLGFANYASAQLAPGAAGTPPKDVLKGVLPAETTALGTLYGQYKDADFAQADAQKDAATLLAELHEEVAKTLNPLRRDLQGAADQAFSHRDSRLGAQRKAFGLPPDRPLND